MLFLLRVCLCLFLVTLRSPDEKGVDLFALFVTVPYGVLLGVVLDCIDS